MPRAPKGHTNGFVSAEDLLSAADPPPQTLTVPGWKVAGVPTRICVRGLTLPEREEVQLASWKDGKQDEQALIVGYLRYGIVMPPLNDAQAAQLARKHAGTVTFVARFIQDLTNLDYDFIQAVANALAGDGERSAEPADAAPPP